MNSTSEIIMSLAYILFLASVLPNMRSMWSNRNELRGFSKFGVTVTAAGLLLVQVSLWMDGIYAPFVIGVPNACYWLVLSIIIWRN